MNPKICAYFGYDNKVVNEYLNHKELEGLDKELDFINKCENKRFIHKMTDDDKVLFDLGYKVLKEKRKDLEVDYKDYSRNKIKVDGQERKLFRYLSDKDLSEEIGKYKLPNKDLYFVISTNPDDFVLCSTNNKSWTSCTDLINGSFKFTAMGNVFTNGRFIMYITDLTEKEFLDAKSYDMIFRAFGFVGKDGNLYGNIWYPMRENMDLYIEDIHIHSMKETTYAKYPIDKVCNKYGSFTTPYIDYGQIFKNEDNLTYYWSGKDYRTHYPLTYYIDYKEPVHTSTYYWYDGMDVDKAIKRKCDCCGSKYGAILTHGNKNYCRECAKDIVDVCCVCGEEKHNCQYTEDNEWICEDCIKEKKLNKCACCGSIMWRNTAQCRHCNSTKVDPFKNIEYEYYDLEADNVRDYFTHMSIEAGECPPGLLEDEEFFEEHEIYLKA